MTSSNIQMRFKRILTVFIAVITTCSASSANTACFKDLCPGDWVRDRLGWKSIVTGFDPDTATVWVQMAETGAPWKFQYSELGKSVRCHLRFCTQNKVVDSNQNIGTVEEVYTHGLVYVYMPDFDGYFLYREEELQPAIES